MTIKSRPKHLNLFKIRFPVTAVASILHRISGTLMFLFTPFAVYYFALSLQNPPGFAAAVAWLDSGIMQLVLMLMIWSLIHHLLMGIRFLLVDFDIGIELSTARMSAMSITVAAVVISLLVIQGVLL